MKKITYLFAAVFVAVLVCVPARVYATECSSYGVSNCNGQTDSNGNKCVVSAINDEGKSVSPCCTISGKTCGSKIATDSGSGKAYGGTDIPDFIENQKTVSCGKIKNIPDYIPFITNLTIIVLTIISMGMLVIMGTIDLFKGINSGKPEDMKKNQKVFFSRVGSAVLLFFIVALTKLLVSFFTGITGGNSGIIDCIGCFINNSCN